MPRRTLDEIDRLASGDGKNLVDFVGGRFEGTIRNALHRFWQQIAKEQCEAKGLVQVKRQHVRIDLLGFARVVEDGLRRNEDAGRAKQRAPKFV
jgi:hypothetical protein